MNASKQSLLIYMTGAKTRFIIPVYQRNYDWKLDNCKQLYSDLVKVVKNDRPSHFFGSVVSALQPSGEFVEYLVIDGQQRLTTVSLLMLAMYNLIKNKIIKPREKRLGDLILEEYLIDKYEPLEKRIKLKPVKNDMLALEKLFEEDENERIKSSNLTINYNYFYETIQDEEITIDDLFSALKKLQIVHIALEPADNPQLIFESLNSTGLDLNEGDKIRNYVLMGLTIKEQNLYYEQYWNKIEELTNYEVSAFIRDYLSIKQMEIPSQNKIYIKFKEYWESKNIDIKILLEELLIYAKRYSVLLRGKTGNSQLDSCIIRLNRLETTVTRPFFLEVLRLYDEKSLSLIQVAEIFQLTESYLFRRTICEVPTNALNKIFLTLHREIIKYDDTSDNYVEKFIYALTGKRDKGRFPDNDEFAENFSKRPIYKMNKKHSIYILERLENYETLEDKDVYRHCDDGTYTIEHIMPQHLTPEWQHDLGDDYEQIHETWLHRIANLTLTAYNPQYSNYSFTAKKAMKNGFQCSGIRLNMLISQKDQWTLAELEERDSTLTSMALNIWNYPTTHYLPSKKAFNSHSLDEDASEMTGRSIVKFSYKNTEHPIKNWAEMFQKVLQMLYAEYPEVFEKLADSEDYDSNRIAFHFSRDHNKFIKSVDIGSGVYANVNSSTVSKLNVLLNIFKDCKVDADDLMFFLKEDDASEEKDVAPRHELRRKYWTYALKFIRKENEESGLFKNVNPSSANWIGCATGVYGCSINCVANYDLARVEFYVKKDVKKDKNEKYDILRQNQIEIEQTLTVPLQWEAGNDYKWAKVCIVLSNVSIEQESDWEKMAEFQAEWSKKFYDVLKPYLL